MEVGGAGEVDEELVPLAGLRDAEEARTWSNKYKYNINYNIERYSRHKKGWERRANEGDGFSGAQREREWRASSREFTDGNSE